MLGTVRSEGRQMDDRRVEVVRSVPWFLRYERKGAVRLS